MDGDERLRRLEQMVESKDIELMEMKAQMQLLMSQIPQLAAIPTGSFQWLDPPP